jgi:hypothetical protein
MDALPLLDRTSGPRPSAPPPVSASESFRRSVRSVALAAAVAFSLGLCLATVARVAGAVSRFAEAPADTANSLSSLATSSSDATSASASSPRVRSRRKVSGHAINCESDMYTKQTLKLVTEFPIAHLVHGLGAASPGANMPKYEASDVTGLPGPGRTPLYVVMDNSFTVIRLGSNMVPSVPVASRKADSNALLAWPGNASAESQFEGLTYNMTSGTFIAVQEMITHKNGHMHARMYDVAFPADGEVAEVRVLQECGSDYKFARENKGLEGSIVMDGPSGVSYLLGLCEGNYCGDGNRHKESGNGRLVVMKRSSDPKTGTCLFVTVQTIALPSSCDFMDYSAITINQGKAPGKNGAMDVAIASQENSAVWIGTIAPAPRAKSADSPLFVFGDGAIFDFPTDDGCNMVYCNVEGIHWQDDSTLVAVSDAMKSHGRQDYRCWNKAQSVHLFSF